LFFTQKNILYGVESFFFCLIPFFAYLLDTVSLLPILDRLQKRLSAEA
jgi:hypothetical protein